MKVTQDFVKWFLSMLCLVLLTNLVAIIFGVYRPWIAYLTIIFLLALFFLIFRKKEEGHLKFAKLVIILSMIFLFGYLIYINFISTQTFTYFYDIGDSKDSINPYLTPIERTSNVSSELVAINDLLTNVTYRNLSSRFVYLSIEIPWRANNLTIEMKIKNNFPRNGRMLIGQSTSKNGDYDYIEVYNKSIFNISQKNWVTIKTSFNLTNSYLENNKLKLLINTPHLAGNITNLDYIPIDWINLTIKRNGIF